MDNISKYMTPMDELDIALLSLDNVWMKTAQPIRGRNDFNFDSNYSSEESDVSDTNDDYSDSSNVNIDLKLNCICYICNIKVPKMFMKDHIISSKHKTYLKIANTALKRVNKYMNQNICISKNRSSLHFCDICVVAVESKSNHILSDSHKIAVKKEKMFNSLVELYIDEDFNVDVERNNSNETRNYEKTTENDGHLRHMSIPTTEASLDDLKLQTLIKSSNIVNMKDINDDSNILNTKYKEILTIKEQEITTNQLKILNSGTVKSHVLKSFDGMYYIIETKYGIQIKVERDKYHSFKKIGKRKYICQLCSTFCQRKGTHILSEKHLEKVSSPIKDKHCVREVDASITHCILCNELIESYLLHTVCNNNHMELLKKSIIESDNFDLRNESKSKIALDVNKKLDPICESKDEFKPGGSHKTVLDVGSLKLHSENKAIDDKVPANQDSYLKQESIATNVPSQTNQSSGSYESKMEEMTSIDHPDWHMIETTTKGISCKFCNVTIPNTMKNKIEHLNGSKHKRTVSELLEVNKLIVKNGLFYCEYCNDYVKNELQYNHIQFESHKENIKSNETEIKSTDDNIATIIAESNSDQNNDKDNSVKDIESNKITTEVISTKEIGNYNINTNISTASKAIEEAIEYNPLIMEKTPKGNEITCKICNVIVPLRNCNIQEHLKAQKHKNNEKILLEKNKIIIKDSRTFCELCLIYIKDDMKFNHLQTYFHVKKLEFFEYQNNNDANFKRMKTIFTYILNLIENGNVMCKICNVSIPNSEFNVTEHIYGKKHNHIEIETFKKNKMIIKDVNSHCEACSLYVNNGMEHVHIETSIHKENMMRLNKANKIDKVKKENQIQLKQSINLDKYYGIVRSTSYVVHCSICNVDIPDSVNNLNMHLEEKLHKLKLKILFPNLYI